MKFPQIATYWDPASVNEFNEKVFAASIEISVRWEERTKETITPEGEVVTFGSVVFMAEDLERNGYLFLGSSPETDPLILTNAHRILRISKIPSLKGFRFIRRVWLSEDIR